MRINDTLDRLPVYYYDKALIKKDYRYLISGVDEFSLPDVTDEEQQELSLAWVNINFELIDVFRMSLRQKSRLMIEKDIIILELEYAITNNRELLTRIKIKEKMLESNSAKKSKDDRVPLDMQIANMEAYFKMQFDSRKTSTLKYFSYIKLYEAHLNRLKREKFKRKK